MDNMGISHKIPMERKLAIVKEYLVNGGEVTIEGRTYVWLDNYVTREEVNRDGSIEYMGIDGLAIKAERYNSGTGETKPHYLGMTDMPLGWYQELVNHITEEDWVGMTASNALVSMIPDRR